MPNVHCQVRARESGKIIPIVMWTLIGKLNHGPPKFIGSYLNPKWFDLYNFLPVGVKESHSDTQRTFDREQVVLKLGYWSHPLKMANPYHKRQRKPQGFVERSLSRLWSGFKYAITQSCCGAVHGKGIGVAAKILVFLLCCGLFFLQFGDIFALYQSQVSGMFTIIILTCLI